MLLKYELRSSTIDPTPHFLQDEQNRSHQLVVATQVDDLLYGGSKDELSSFEKYVGNHYEIRHISEERFVFSGLKITHDPFQQEIILSHLEENKIENIDLSPIRSKQNESPASDLEKNLYRSLTGSLLWRGSQTVPHLMYLASSMARKIESLKVKHLKLANSKVKYAKNSAAIIQIQRSNTDSTKIIIFTDASHGSEGEFHSQEESIIFKLDENSASLVPLLWSSRKIKGVVNSTLAAETIAAVNGCDDGIYIQHLLNKC